ncbi:MAG: sulfate adenylyltransferase subunit CysN [Wolinella succinogenes]|uniref:sulfate adenylyltransferase subunit CysN n=1 Tax=Wolinella succinogenes TaxID=844 RepID=UPI001691582D|nr:sulfate adenylyltransferase subunit CysN [Wolinella succinogenes]NLU35364.1 sulfate adenylyltransferase subunit CysN [Wolinella succinogenes]
MILDLKGYQNKELCRFITCGSVDDGKSTLIGRLLYDSQMILEDQLSSVTKDSKKYGTTGEKIDLALLVDGLASEREQGITIDVAYRYFTTDKRKFIIADTPGHEQYTRNMATGASTADVAIILIDARKGVLTQTRRHSYIVSLLGIQNIIIAVNKMDLVDFSQERFEEIKAQYSQIIPCLPHHQKNTFTYLPLSALEGDNVVSNSNRMPWYKGGTLLTLLNTMEIGRGESRAFRFCVQYVNRPHLNFRGFCGMVMSGAISVGERVVILPSNKKSTIASIISDSITDFRPRSAQEEVETIQSVSAPLSTTLVLEDEIDISRGDVIVKEAEYPHMASVLEAMIVWMSEKSLDLHEGFIVKKATTIVNGKFQSIEFKKDINTFKEIAADSLELNDIAKCVLSLDRPIAFDLYEENRQMGSFIVIDKYTNETLAAGMITGSAQQDGSNQDSFRRYTLAEIELNAFIRKNYPEWECKAI